MIVDHVAAPTVAMGATAGQALQRRGAEKQIQPIIVEVYAQGVADQLRGHRVEHLAQGEAAVRGDADALQFEVLGALRRQRLQRGAFGVDADTVAGVVAADDLGDESTIGSEVVEVAAAAQQQGLFDGALEVAVGAFNAAVFMGDTAVVARGSHTVVSAQLLVASGEVVLGGLIEVVVGGRKAVGTVLFGAPPSSHKAFWQPPLKATKLSPPSTTSAYSKPE